VELVCVYGLGKNKESDLLNASRRLVPPKACELYPFYVGLYAA
jgi:hypothetical protein